MKGTEHFEKVIHDHLSGIASQDINFKKKFNDPSKNIKDCITYILHTVQKSGCNGFSDEEIFGMAIHYYDEEKIEIGHPINAKVVVNHTDFKGKKVARPHKDKITRKDNNNSRPSEQLSMF